MEALLGILINKFAWLGVAIGFYWKAKSWTDNIAKKLEPTIKKAEQLALDGKIDKSDREKIVIQMIFDLEQSGDLKLNFITRKLAMFIVKKIAAKLPDFEITKRLQ